MTPYELKGVNELATVKIKGKDYVMVNERIKAFRNNFKGFSLETEIIDITSESCTMRAVVRDDTGRIIATGTAQERKQSSNINNTSYVENCETSAWGRALGNLGIGVDTSICSAEELSFALKNQKEIEEREQSEKAEKQAIKNFQKDMDSAEPIITKATLEKLNTLISEMNKSPEQVARAYKAKALSELTEKQGQHAIKLCEDCMRKEKC